MAADIKPIRTEADHETALAEVERLWGAPLGTPDGDRLDVLATLIDVYEARNHAVDPPDPIAAIRFRMEQRGLTLLDLEAVLGPMSRAMDILERRRSLSVEMIRRLHDDWGIAADVLIRPTIHLDVA